MPIPNVWQHPADIPLCHNHTEDSMKRLTLLSLMAMGTALAACGPVHPANDARDHSEYAADKDAMVSYYFYRMDTNGDGWVSRAEHDSFSGGMFTRVDGNRDGYITYRELNDYKTGEWNDWRDNYSTREGHYEGEKYYPYGKSSPTRTPNEPYNANRSKTDRSYKDYETRDHNDDYDDRSYPQYRR